jgi:ETFB lysine methyltransferase
VSKGPARADDPRALSESLLRRFRTIDTAVAVGERTLTIVHPANADELISEVDFDRDERLPYWAELWPSARVLGELLLAVRGEGRSLLELGCGSGLVATCASLAGFTVCATDYYEDALRFARLNALRNGAPEIETRVVDWRSMPNDLGTFDVVVASDVLYEPAYGALVANAVASTLRAGGRAFVADPGRVGREEFVKTLRSAKLEVVERLDIPFVDGKIRQTIAVFAIDRA